MASKLAVGAVIFRNDGAVLLVRRKAPPAIGSWTLPGGKVERDETLENAVVREIAEETSLRIEPITIVETLTLEREGYSYRIVDFLCRNLGDDEPRASDDVDAARWVLPHEFESLSLTPEVLRVIASARTIATRSMVPQETFTAVYRVLHRLATRQLRKGGANTLDTTALVHEAWLKLAVGAHRFESRAHYLAVAATAMRQILVDHARRRRAKKRGGEAPLTEDALSHVGIAPVAAELLAIDAALTKLAALDERLARVVEWRFFAGLDEAEIASALDVDVRTVRRDWRKARAFILGELA